MPSLRRRVSVWRHLQDAAEQEPAIAAQWEKRFGKPSEIASRFPSHGDDAVAVELVVAARQIGVDLESTGRQAGEPLRSQEDRDFEKLGKYVSGQIERTSGEIEAPSGPLCEYLDRHRPAIDEIANRLALSPPPRWEASPGSLAGPVPNLLGLRRIQQVLIADAFARALQGESRLAELRLLAAWNLNASLRDRTDLISQIVAIANARTLAGAARWLDLDDEAWEARFADQDYRASVVRALSIEAASIRPMLDGDGAFFQGSRADFYRISLDFIAQLEKTTIADSARGPVVYPEPTEMLSAGEVMAPMGFPNVASAWRKADRLRLEAELTEKVLAAKRERRRRGGWPDRLDGVEASALGEPHWVYGAEGGHVRIGLSAPLEWKNWSGWLVPLEFASD